MTRIDSTRVTIRIDGDNLDPNEVAKLLGAIGEGRVRQITRDGVVVSRGSWRLTADTQSPGDLSSQIRGLFSDLTNDLAV